MVALVTVMPDGQPQATPVWVDYDGTYVIVNTARGRQKDKNMNPGAKVTVLAIDPEEYPALAGSSRRDRRGDRGKARSDVINALSLKYRGEPDYFARNPQLRGVQQRVTYKIEPTAASIPSPGNS